MEGTGILENPALLTLLLPDFKPRRNFRLEERRSKHGVECCAGLKQGGRVT
jgi:hypothetical protein